MEKIDIRAFANGDDCLVIWRAPELQNCVGFAIGRERKLPLTIERKVIENRLGFKGQSMTAGETKPSTIWPFQRYDWTDPTVSTGDEVRYCVTPVFRRGGMDVPDPTFSSDWTPWIALSPSAGSTSVYFNRGLVMSQFMARALKGDFSSASLKRFKKNLSSHEDPLRRFLGGDLLLKMRSLLEQAKADGLHVYAALYELSDPELIAGLAALKRRAHVVLANGSNKAGDGNKEAAGQLEGVVDLHRRMLGTRGLGHNKFLVFADANHRPRTVWTGSTNWAETGLCTQVNNGILVDDEDLADEYLKYWRRLKKAGDSFPTGFKEQNSAPIDVGTKYSVYLTPTKSQVDLAYAGKLLEDAKESVFFLMFKPGRDGLLGAVQQRRLAARDVYLYGVINDLEMSVTTGPTGNKQTTWVHLVNDEVEKKFPFSILEPEGVKAPLATWAAEVTRRDFFGKSMQHPTVGHAIIHAKLFVIDAFGENPVVVTGSHNFSKSASEKNDENLLLIRNNRELAVKYSVAINAIYGHYRWRALLNRYKIDAGLDLDDRWQKRKRTTAELKRIDFWTR